MKLYEAIESVVSDFGKEIITKANVINMLSDYKAFEESRTFKIIIKNLIAEGYMDQLLYMRDWSKTGERTISNFINATSFNEANASYVIKSFAYGLGYTKNAPTFQSIATTPTVANSKQTKAPTTKVSSIQGVSLDKTHSQVERLSNAAQQKYKEAAEEYLGSIVEFKTDFEKELGVKINSYVVLDQYGNIFPKFEIDGKIKVEYNKAIAFHVLFYDQKDRMMTEEVIYVGKKKGIFEVAQCFIRPKYYNKVGDIKRIVVYWEQK